MAGHEEKLGQGGSQLSLDGWFKGNHIQYHSIMSKKLVILQVFFLQNEQIAVLKFLDIVFWGTDLYL